MGRHTIRADGDFKVVVGWDDPLGTFFAIVYDINASNVTKDDVIRVWVGVRPGEITDLRLLEQAVRRYATIPSDVIVALGSERENRQEPTAFQRETFKRLTGDNLP